MNRQDFEAAAKPLVDFAWFSSAVDELETHMEQDGGHDFAHLLRVLRSARRIAGASPCDWEVVAMSVLLHDAINLPKNHPERHLASTYSAEVGQRFAAKHLGEDRVAMVEDAIRAHSHSAGFKPRFFESEVLADADRLESLGAFGIARTFYVSGVMGRSIVEMSDPFGVERQLDDLNFAVDHFFKKLLTLRDVMYTAEGRAIADERHEFLHTFLAQLADELGVPSPAR